MVQVLSKLAPIHATCVEYVHPWTTSCLEAIVGCYLCAVLDSFRIYTSVYLLALLMKGKIPTKDDMKKTVAGILQSTAFLSATGFGYSFFLCILRRVLGHFNFITTSAVPAFLASIFAILIERPSRRLLLCLYVSNVATETFWNMAVTRNWVSPVKNGVVSIFSISIAILLMYYKKGLHKGNDDKVDSMFRILRLIVGPYEEKNYVSQSSLANTIYRHQRPNDPSTSRSSSWGSSASSTTARNTGYHLVTQALRIYKRLIYKIKCLDRHSACPHPFGCVYYTMQGLCKMAGVGLSIQLALNLVLNLKNIIISPSTMSSIILRKKNLSLAIFLGGFAGLFRACSCILRRVTGFDSPYNAIPAGLIAGIAFKQYPDTTVALYVLWKMAQITYNLGIDKGILPRIPGFTIFLYCLSTATLFHAALVEPANLRPSYWKFLHSLSAGRIASMNRIPLDAWGLQTSQQLLQVLKHTKTDAVVQYYGWKCS